MLDTLCAYLNNSSILGVLYTMPYLVYMLCPANSLYMTFQNYNRIQLLKGYLSLP